MITQLELKKQLNYDLKTGIFTWKISKQRIKITNIAGYKTNEGYLNIKLNKKQYQSHRLAWLYVYGTWPKNCIDHINGIKNDNRIENLREVTIRKNNQNKNNHRTGKLVGANYNKIRNKWQAHIKINNKKTYLGSYSTEIEAHKAYLKALNTLPIE